MEQPEHAYFDLLKETPQLADPEKFYYETETKCIAQTLDAGLLSPIIQSADISQLNDKELQYIEQRAAEEKNPNLLARYTHILYQRLKHTKYAHVAADSYLSLAQDYLSNLEKEDRHIYELMNLIESYANLCLSAKYKGEQCKAQIITWLNQPGQHLSYYESLTELIASSKLFKRADLEGSTRDALERYSRYRVDSHNESYLEACLLLAKKEGADTIPIYIALAESQLDQVEHCAHDTSGLLKADLLSSAAEYYKLAKNKERSNELLIALEQNKKSIKFDVISHQMSREHVKIIMECTQVIVDHHLKAHDRTVFLPIALEPRMIPKPNEGRSNENSFLHSITTSLYDINLNSHKLSSFELKRREDFQDFQIEMEHCLAIYFRELVKKMKQEKRDFLAEGLHYFENTWLARELQNGYADHPQLYSWMPMLRPAFEILIKANQGETSRVLSYHEQMSFDQLAIKFEGLLRDLCGLARLNITKTYKGTTVAKDVNELLQSKDLSKVFQEEDIRLWQYAFTGSGYNIRNNVAHAFYRPKDYTLTLANVLLLAYIKLAKYGNLVKYAEQQSMPSKKNT